MCCSFIDDMHLIETLQSERLVPMRITLDFSRPDMVEVRESNLVEIKRARHVFDVFNENKTGG